MTFARFLIIRHKPVTTGLETLLDRRELKVGMQTHELVVAGGFLELAVALGSVKYDLTFEIHRLYKYK